MKFTLAQLELAIIEPLGEQGYPYDLGEATYFVRCFLEKPSRGVEQGGMYA